MATDFSKILFFKHDHTYHYDGRQLPSVSSLVNRLKPPFDSDYWAQRKAEERGVEKAAILAEWEAKRKAGFERGTRVHEYIAGVLTNQHDVIYGPGWRLPEMDAFDAVWKRLRQESEMRPVTVEGIVGDVELNFAGTLDALLFSEVTGRHHIFDWKTGSKFRVENRFQTMLPPFEHLEECELVSYSLQVSLYQLAIERNTELVMGASYMVHLDEYGESHILGALDMRGQAEAWLKDGCR